jgi:hypothetical protein
MKRKITQIAVSQTYDHSTNLVTIMWCALCDDGSIWNRWADKNGLTPWLRQPQDEIPVPLEELPSRAVEEKSGEDFPAPPEIGPIIVCSPDERGGAKKAKAKGKKKAA